MTATEVGGLDAPAPRETPAPREALRFPALDGLRGLAALAVLTTHVGFQTGRTNQPGPIGFLLARGDFGVTVFFLLSGFLLYRPMLKGLPAPAVRTYVRRRCLRVLPLYWLAVVAALTLLPQNDGAGAREWWRHLTLTQVYGMDLPAGLTQMWSLCTEVAFYAVLPLFAIVVTSLRRRTGQEVGRSVDVISLGLLFFFGLAFTAAAAQVGSLPKTAHLWLPAYADWFALGMGLAVLHTRLVAGSNHRWTRVVIELSRAPGTCLAVGTLLFLLAATPLAGPKLLEAPTAWEASAKHLLYGLSALFLLLPSVFSPPGSTWSRALASRPLHWAGQISYSVFALHLVVLHFTFRSLGYPTFSGHFAAIWLATATASLAVASATYLVLERPMLRWGARR